MGGSGKRMGIDMGMRCKQCNQPITSANIAESAFGTFCSDAAKKVRSLRAARQQLEHAETPVFRAPAQNLIGKLIVILILLVALGVPARSCRKSSSSATRSA